MFEELKNNLYKLENDAFSKLITCHINLTPIEAKLVSDVFSLLNNHGARLRIKREAHSGVALTSLIQRNGDNGNNE